MMQESLQFIVAAAKDDQAHEQPVAGISALSEVRSAIR